LLVCAFRFPAKDNRGDDEDHNRPEDDRDKREPSLDFLILNENQNGEHGDIEGKGCGGGCRVNFSPNSSRGDRLRPDAVMPLSFYEKNR
jgi:hypothetical protein